MHADIGSDHARLPIHLLRSGRTERVIVVEKTAAPAEVAHAALAAAGLAARSEVRLGDGFAPIRPDEVTGASVTGMGARTILGIVRRAAELPPHLVLQSNDSAEGLRRWALTGGYQLEAEALAPGFWAYPVLSLRRGGGEDPAYVGLPREAALRFGPHLLRRRDPLLVAELQRQQERLMVVARHGRGQVQRDLAVVREALACLHP